MLNPAVPSPAEWLGLLLTSESDQPHEWRLIGWAVRNRMLSGKHPKSAVGVILEPSQFSYFNQWTKDLDLADLEDDPVAVQEALADVFAKAMAGYAGDRGGAGRHAEATACAEAILGAHLWEAPFGRDVLHYYSPVSMKPAGTEPPFFKKAKRKFTPEGVDPGRFVFGAGIP